jgi:hypothetical protein
MSFNTAADFASLNASSLLAYNATLEENASVSRLDEKFLEQRWRELEGITLVFDKLYWLSVARINELALLCAGNHADNFEFTDAADLLVNPRLVLIHVKNLPKPVAKIRHLRTTEQFSDIACARNGVIQWLKSETSYEIKEKPLLADLYERLENSGFMSQQYLESVERRMKQIAETIHFLSSWHVYDIRDYCPRLQCATSPEKAFIGSNLCGFDKSTFNQLSYDLRQIAKNGGYRSKFLKVKYG